jgi:glycosyltransferase involved in cell wall biosynthesis
MLIEIGILSYNRPQQLKRIFDSVVDGDLKNFTISVYDDCSPLSDRIFELVSIYKELIPGLNLVSRPVNIGYDLNLINAIQNSAADYIVMLSDDDFIDLSGLHDLYCELEVSTFDYGILPYFNNTWHRISQSGYKSLAGFIYDSILFSGLVFRPGFFNSFELNFLSNKVYSQVYLACLVHNFGSIKYLDSKTILLGGDGLNFFGHSSSSSDLSLADRSNLISNFIYQQKLLFVLKVFDSNFSTSYFRYFRTSYFIRVVALLFKIRYQVSFRFFWSLFPELSKFYLVSKPLLVMISLIPKYVSKFLYQFGINFKKSG